MADVFDIDSGNRIDYHRHHKDFEKYNHRGPGGWTTEESNRNPRKDPRLANRRDDVGHSSLERKPVQLYDKLGVPISPVRSHYSRSPSPRRSSRGHHRQTSECNSNSPRNSTDHDGWHSPQRMPKPPQMYSQPPPQTYQQPPPPPLYEQYNTSGYPSTVSTYQQGYTQAYGQPQTSSSFNQYNTQSGYTQQSQGYNSGHQQPGPPGDEYPGAWAPVPTAYLNMSHPPPPVTRPSTTSSSHTTDVKKDNLKKEAIANEMKQQQATLVKQRDEYLRKASVLRRELEKLRLQKHDLLSEKSPPRDSQRILRENAKLQLEIQNKLKSINNVVDMLSGIIGDGMKAGDEDKTNSSSSSPKRVRKQEHPIRPEQASLSDEEDFLKRPSDCNEAQWPHCNFVHYDPELHWCRVCDVFPRSAKDFLNHLHSTEHRQVTQEHQLVDTPWHKLPSDPELPSYKGAPIKRVPIKGLQFFISATSWYCKLCDAWIGDLHCASIHLKSKNHAHNYSNFVEQNPLWESNWIKDREKAFERCAKTKQDLEGEEVPPAPDPPLINDKLKRKKRKDKHDSPFLDSSKERKRKKKSKKRKKMESSGSSSSSSSSDSSSEDDSDKSKSIRVAMRNKMRMQAQMILKEEIGGKLEALGRLVEEERHRQKELIEDKQQESNAEDNIINQWMNVNNANNDKHILNSLKGRLKQRQEADKEKAIEAAAEQRKREREREECELKEMREREQRELEEKIHIEKEREERDREEREKIKEKERNRRRHHSSSHSPDRFRGRSRSRSVDRRRIHGQGRSQERQYRRNDKKNDNRHSPEPEKYRPKRSHYEEERSAYESHFEKQTAESAAKSNKGKKTQSSSSRKLPFIGRMPLFKKKSDGEEKEIKKEDYDIPRQSKFEPGSSARAFIPEPGVVHITKLATPPDPLHMIRINAENPPPPPKIIPEPPQISSVDELAPPPPIITETTPNEEVIIEVQDMELDDAAAPPLPPGVPVCEAKPLAKPAGNHLPRDFQEALNIIFPGDQRPEHLNIPQDPNLMMQYQYGMGYGMLYPNMHMYDYSTTQETTVIEEETILQEEDKILISEPLQPAVDDNDDLAMLGIDAEDMAAQTF